MKVNNVNRFVELREQYAEKNEIDECNQSVLARVMSERISQKRKMKINIPQSTVWRAEKNNTASLEVLSYYCQFFNVSYEYLLGESHFKTIDDIEIAQISKKTGLSDKAINNIIKLNEVQGEEIVHPQHQYVLYMLNSLLENYENTTILNLMYHYLFGDYKWFGCKDSTSGNTVYESTEIIVSDNAYANQATINVGDMSGAILATINETLTFWKKDIASDESKQWNKMIPSKENITEKLKTQYNSKNSIEKNRGIYKQSIYNNILDSINTGNDDDTECYAINLIAYKNALNSIDRRIEELRHSLKYLYNCTYDEKTGKTKFISSKGSD